MLHKDSNILRADKTKGLVDLSKLEPFEEFPKLKCSEDLSDKPKTAKKLFTIKNEVEEALSNVLQVLEYEEINDSVKEYLKETEDLLTNIKGAL